MSGDRSSGFSRRGFLQGVGAATTATLVIRRAQAEGAGEQAGGWSETVVLDTVIDGESHPLEVPADETAVELLRGRLGLTGTKESCGRGACGACTILLDGDPVASCILPASALHGREVKTIASFREPLHPVQRAFLAEDGLQCGFCTPGMVLEAIAFTDRWRADHGDVEPDHDTIVSAMEGHLCRCGAYDGIFRAIAAACRGEHDGSETPLAERVDALEKVTGEAVYTVDVRLEGQLEGRVLRSPHPHARVRRIDVSKAEAMDGVRATWSFVREGGMARFHGQELVAVAAVDRRTADRALAAIDIDYDVLPAVMDVDTARQLRAPLVYSSQRRKAPNSAEMPKFPARWSGNVRGPTSVGIRMKRTAARDAVHKSRMRGDLFEGRWSTQTQSHTALEPHAAVADWRGRQSGVKASLTVHLSTQANTLMAEDIAIRWGLRMDDVVVLCPYVGGGFGAKSGIHPELMAAVELSRRAGAPVRVAWDRDEEMISGGGRAGVASQVSLSVEPDGSWGGLVMDSIGDGGVSVGSASALFSRVLYNEPVMALADFDVVTNAPVCKPLRAPGGPPAFWAVECSVDQLAHDRKLDPVALRRNWNPSASRVRLLDWAETIPEWRDRPPVASESGRYRRGIGLAVGTWIHVICVGTRIALDAEPDGRFVARCASQDPGTGGRSVVAATLARELGVGTDRIDVRFGDSRFPVGPLSGGSQCTTSLVPAAIDAAEAMNAELVDRARGTMGLVSADFAEGGVKYRDGFAPIDDILAAGPRISVVGRRTRDEGGYAVPVGFDNYRLGKAFTQGVQVAEVEVDTRLGRTRVRQLWGGYAAGRIVLPQLATHQAHGGMLLGIGYALFEERRVCPSTGVLLTHGLEDYRFAGPGDVPRFHVHWDEEGYDNVAGGSLGLAELTTVSVAASIGNAVYHATGWRPLDLPIRPDRLLAGVTS